MNQKRQDGQLRVNLREFHHTFHNHRFYTLKLCVGWFCFYESLKNSEILLLLYSDCVSARFSLAHQHCRPLFWTSWSGSIRTTGRSEDVQPEGSVKESFGISRSSGGSGVFVPIGARMQRWRMRPGRERLKLRGLNQNPPPAALELSLPNTRGLSVKRERRVSLWSQLWMGGGGGAQLQELTASTHNTGLPLHSPPTQTPFGFIFCNNPSS